MSKYVYHPDRMLDTSGKLDTSWKFFSIKSIEDLDNFSDIKSLLKNFFNLERVKGDMENDNWKYLFGTWKAIIRCYSPFILLHFLTLLGINPIADWSESEIKFIFGDGILKYTPIITKEEN